VKRDAKNSSDAEEENFGKGKEPRTHPQNHNTDETDSRLDDANETDSRLDDAKTSKHTIIPLDDIVTNLDENTSAHLTNLQLSIPSDLDLGDIDPDFSRMILNVDSVIGSLEIVGDYTLFVRNVATLPSYSRGRICVNLENVTIKGSTNLALTPAAFLTLDSDYTYDPQEIIARVNPMSEITSTGEISLSKDTVTGTLATLINKEVEDHLNYYVNAHINLVLSKISVFTVGHKNDASFTNVSLTQNVQIGDLFDEMLTDVKKEILDSHKDEIGIPNFHRNFSEKLESNIINGSFSAEQGWLSGLSSLRRASNVSLSKSGEVFILSAVIEFADLQMGYDKYVAMFLKSKVTGELDGTFIHRQLTIKVTMDPKEDGTCTSTMNELRIFKMNGYRIQEITNIGSFDWLQRKINNWLIGYFQTKIVKDLEKVVSSAVRNSLSRMDCGEYLPNLKILQ
jgi:hypothetical protein